MAAEIFKFLTSEEFGRLGQREKMAYLDRAVLEAARLARNGSSPPDDTLSEPTSPDPDNASRTKVG